MGMKYLAAYTTVEQFSDPVMGHQGPPYINFTEDTDRHVVVVSGRDKAGPGEVYGRGFRVEIPKAEFDGMILDCWKHVTQHP